MQENLFKGKYRTQSTRLPGWNYSWSGIYFVTICAKDRELLFGKIINEKMILNNVGKIVNEFWQKIPEHFPFIDLDTYIVMPNHIHGIIMIGDDPTCRDEALPRLYMGQYPEMSKISPKQGSLSVIIGSFKSACSKIIKRQIDPYFSWQPRFYDRIIRNQESLQKARAYILDNPFKWYRDRNNLEGLGMM